jgi:histidinol-phosphate aminotransferase
MLRPRQAVQDLPTYHPPLAGRTGLRLDFNENTVGCSPRVLERLRQLTAEDLARYPEREPVEARAAAHLKIRPDELLLTNGVDEAIHLVCETYLEAGDDALIVVPTFSMYEIFAAAPGARIRKIPAAANFSFPTQTILRSLSPATRLIALANPNNPTGSAAPLDDIELIARSAPDAAILADEAYFEFHGETMLGRWEELPNLLVARTFSKAYGLAGFRLGILAGNAAQIAALRKVASPYNVNGIALACLSEALNDQAYIRQYVEQVCRGRDQLESELQKLNIPFWPSRANFVLLKLGESNALFVNRMRARGILVRDRSRDPGCEGCVRITLGSTEHNERLLTTMPEVLREIGAIPQLVRR